VIKKLKILMTLMGMEIGGAETHVLELSKTLHKMGVDVHVVSNGGVYVKELEACGIKHYRVPLHNKQFLNVFSSYKALKKIIIENDFKLVHAHARIPAFICGMLQKRLKFKLVTTAHLDFNVAFPYNKLSTWGDRTLAVSEDIKDYLLANYRIKESNIRVTVNGMDTEKFSPSVQYADVLDELNLSDETFKIVNVGRLDRSRHSGLSAFTLIEIAETLKKASPKSFDIIIVGDGDDFHMLKTKADAINARHGVFVHMVGQRTDIHKFCAMADVFVNPSRSALEAMSAQTPVVLCGNQGFLGIINEDSIPMALQTNFTCRGCEALTPDKLLAALDEILHMNKTQLDALGLLGRQIVAEHYSLERMAQDAIAVYDEMLYHNETPMNVMISGYYGVNNSGDDVMLESILDNLRTLMPGLNLTVLSLKPKETKAQFKVDTIYRFNLIQVFMRLRKAHLLITGGGNLLQDETSTRSLIYYRWVMNTAHRLGVKNMLYGNGIGPVIRPGNIRRVKSTLDQVDLITLREPSSLAVLKHMGVNNTNVVVTADPAFALPEMKLKPVLPEDLGITAPYVCVAIRPWGKNPPDFEMQVAAFADYLHKTHGYQIVFVPMRPKQDNEISRNVMSLMVHDAVLLDVPSTDYHLARVVLSGASFALCMRLHALIYAMESGVPAIGLDYGPKVRAFLESMNQRWYMPVEDTNLNALIAFSETIHAHRDDIVQEILISSRTLREKAMLNAKLCVALINDEAICPESLVS